MEEEFVGDISLVLEPSKSRRKNNETLTTRKYINACVPGLKLNVVKKPYKACERVDGKFWVADDSMCCRMFGVVDGRNDFVLGSALKWGGRRQARSLKLGM